MNTTSVPKTNKTSQSVMEKAFRSIFRSIPCSSNVGSSQFPTANNTKDCEYLCDNVGTTMSLMSRIVSSDALNSSSHYDSLMTSSVEHQKEHQQQRRFYVSIDTDAVYPFNGQPCLAMPSFDEENVNDDVDDDLLDHKATVPCITVITTDVSSSSYASSSSPSSSSCSGMVWPPSLTFRFMSRTEFEEF